MLCIAEVPPKTGLSTEQWILIGLALGTAVVVLISAAVVLGLTLYMRRKSHEYQAISG